mmetsp:Transcript_6238/g.26165  ORF Transcript_6238/g.26165 Transcript_6238/m.26165 type:complete len:209 (+) Transcript_6238:3077-3703(+)
MRPAPRKPTPDGMAAATRDESHESGDDENANIESIVKMHDPRETTAIVRIPAGLMTSTNKVLKWSGVRRAAHLSGRRRSKPMSIPRAHASRQRRQSMHSSGDMPSRNQNRRLRQCARVVYSGFLYVMSSSSRPWCRGRDAAHVSSTPSPSATIVATETRTCSRGGRRVRVPQAEVNTNPLHPPWRRACASLRRGAVGMGRKQRRAWSA